jgi:hypothetical protein
MKGMLQAFLPSIFNFKGIKKTHLLLDRKNHVISALVKLPQDEKD